nr:MAG TPA: Major tail protein [Caudoviricetes sp.]
MYIAPNSTVYLLSGVPCDKSYIHTLYFENKNEQYSYFYGKRVKAFTNVSYQRHSKNSIRLECLADDIYNVNYLMFQNTAYGDKWFYAFVNNVEYVNNVTTEITYTIDIIQTWYFDYTLGNCFVEREHTLTDVVGENTVPEPVGAGDTYIQAYTDFMYPRTTSQPLFSLVVYYIPTQGQYIESIGTDYTFNVGSNGNLRGTIYNGIYTGAISYAYPMFLGADGVETLKWINALFKTLDEIGATIISVQQVPFAAWTAEQTGASPNIKSINQPLTFSVGSGTSEYPRTDIYTPKNKKCYTYPYSYMVVTNNKGDEHTLLWEQSASKSADGRQQIRLQISSTVAPTCEIGARPMNYMGKEVNYDEGVLLNDFPMPSWSENTFDRWWAVNKYQFMYNTVTDAITTIANIAAFSVGGAAAGAGGAAGAAVTDVGRGVVSGTKFAQSAFSVNKPLTDDLMEFATRHRTPNKGRGNMSSSGLPVVEGRIGFSMYSMGSKPEYIKMVDEYFSMYGYKICRLKIPNIKAVAKSELRPQWNYIKTATCIIDNLNAPAEIDEQLQSIYNSGITFWMNPNNVGKYNLDNSPRVT